MYRYLCLLAALVFSTIVCADSITVSAAISLKESMSDIAKAFEADTGEKVQLVFGSSGQLLAQIKGGAPVDVFISASDRQVDDLDRLGMVDNSTRRTIAGNRLVLIAPAAGKTVPSGFKSLADPRFGRIGLGNPKTVPAGEYAEQALTHLGLTDALKGRVVYGTNVRQILSYVERAEVAAGIVYATDAMESGDKVHVIATADPSWHDRVQYPAVLVKSSRRQSAAKRFLEYLSGPRARSILRAKGFIAESASAAAEVSR